MIVFVASSRCLTSTFLPIKSVMKRTLSLLEVGILVGQKVGKHGGWATDGWTGWGGAEKEPGGGQIVLVSDCAGVNMDLSE